MNYIILWGLIISGIVGWIKGGQDMKRARHDPSIGIKPSKNLVSFLFLDYN